jgi:hypothetical protein
MKETTAQTFARPPLTFTPEVAERVCAEYRKATTILEYGSGGSTLYAAQQPGKRVFSVETDPDWAGNIRSYIAAHYPQADVRLHVASIGPTKEWGLPRHYSRLRYIQYLRYARTVWNLPGFEHPDLILIDGRFRISCLFTCLRRIRRPTRILFDDFTNRRVYRYVEDVIAPTEIVNRMAIFDIEPGKAIPGWSLRRLRAELLP